MYKKYHMHRKALARLMLWVNVVDITCALINRPFVHHLLDHLIELELFKLWVNACTR